MTDIKTYNQAWNDAMDRAIEIVKTFDCDGEEDKIEEKLKKEMRAI